MPYLAVSSRQQQQTVAGTLETATARKPDAVSSNHRIDCSIFHLGHHFRGPQKETKQNEGRTFFDEVVPAFGPGAQALGVVLFDVGALLDEHHQVAAETVAVLDALRRPLVVARLPERVRRRRQQVLVAVVRHPPPPPTPPPPPPPPPPPSGSLGRPTAKAIAPNRRTTRSSHSLSKSDPIRPTNDVLFLFCSSHYRR